MTSYKSATDYGRKDFFKWTQPLLLGGYKREWFSAVNLNEMIFCQKVGHGKCEFCTSALSIPIKTSKKSNN